MPMHACDGVLLCDRCLWSRNGHLCVLTLGFGSGCLRLALGADKIVRLLVASLSSMPGGTQICNPVVSLCFGALKLIL